MSGKKEAAVFSKHDFDKFRQNFLARSVLFAINQPVIVVITRAVVKSSVGYQ